MELQADEYHVLEKPNLVIEFGFITLQIPGAANKHYTYRVHVVQKGDLEGKRIVSLLIGPDNTRNYKGFGFVTDDGRINVWRRYKGTNYDKHAGALVSPPEGTRVWEAARCCECGRWLTTPESVARGIGPVCAGSG